jgi:hypothetical protein
MTLITSALKTGPPRSKGYRLQTAAGGIDSATGCPEAVVLDRGISACDRSNEQEAIKRYWLLRAVQAVEVPADSPGQRCGGKKSGILRPDAPATRSEPPEDPQPDTGESHPPVLRVGLSTIPFCF